MTEDVVARSLEMEQDHAGQRLEWRFERLGWSAIALLLAAGLAGLFGQGPLSHATASASRGRLVVRYDRVSHHATPTRITVAVNTGASPDTMIAVAIDREFLDAVDVDHVLPEPAETRALDGWVEFHFRRPESGPLQVSLSLVPNELGSRRATVRSGEARLQLTQLVLP